MKLKFMKFMAIAALIAGLPALSACKDKEPEDPTTGGNGGGGDFVIEQKYLNHSIGMEQTNIEIPVLTTLPNSQWFLDPDVRWMMASKKGPSASGVGTVTVSVDKNTSGETRTGHLKISTSTKSYTVTVKQYPNNDVNIEGDFSVKPTGASATNNQPGSPIELSYDDDPSTMFHSRWNPTGPFPFTLEYIFAGQEEVNYIEYVPRVGGGNGVFKQFELYVAQDPGRAQFEKVGEYDFNGAANAKTIVMPAGTVPTAVRFKILSGVGDLVSCAEMRFMRYNKENALNTQLLTVFTDLTCSELLPNMGMEQIQTLPAAFQRIAEALLNNTYDPLEKSFRIHEYEAYSDPTQWNGPLMTKIYSNWDNPMGIAVKRGQPVLILVGDTHGNNLQVQIVGEQGSAAEHTLRPQSQGTFHTIREGVNQITPDQDGQLFLMYTAVPSAPTSKPIKIHIPLGNGEFAGYFDLNEHKTNEKFAEIMRRAKHKYFCVRGNRMVLYFNITEYPREIVDPINQWDNIITWQQNFMGIEDVRPAQWNNHVAGISMDSECGYMWASNWCMGFVEGSIGKLMGLDNLNANADNAWGPAHEMGHINQMAINWASTTESSNNLFSNYVLHRFGRYNSRGKGLYYRFGAVYEKNQSWASMDYENNPEGPEIPMTKDGPFGEETGIHMRLNWQLWNYYHRVRGDELFFGRVFKIMRALGMNETDDCGRKMLEYAVACSEAAGENLTDFFESWGFFKTLNSTIGQYGNYSYRVTLDMIKNAKERMAKFPNPPHALEYIEDRSVRAGEKPGDFPFDRVGDLGYYTTYVNNLQLPANATATVNGSRNITTENCTNAVAIEIRERKGDSYGAVRYASNYTSFNIPSKIQTSGCAVYAVQADGTRKWLVNL